MHPAVAGIVAPLEGHRIELELGRQSTAVMICGVLMIALLGGLGAWWILRRQRSIRIEREPPLPTHGPQGALAHLSHELRTPLTTIIGLAEMLESGSDNHLAQRIRSNGQHLLSIIEDILALGRLDTAKGPRERRPVAVDEILQTVERRHGRRCLELGIQLQMSIGRKCPRMVLADASLVQLAIRCLIENSIKFSGKGEIRVAAEPSRRRDRVHIRIDDDGPGVSREAASQIFQDFRQGDQTSTRAHEGAGLGLSLARRAVRSIGGDVVLAPSKRGASFELILASADINVETCL